MTTARKQRLHHGVLTWGALLAVILVTALFLLSYMLFNSAIHEQYERELRGVINYVEDELDADDLSECIRTGQMSDKYGYMQALLNEMVDDYECAFIYITIPVMGDGDSPSHMFNVVSSTTKEEVANGEEDTPLGDTTYTYPDEEMKKFCEAMKGNGISFFEETSEWGSFYTGSKPVITSDGEAIALINADIELDELHHKIRMFILQYVIMTAIICAIDGLLIIAVLRRRVIDPILSLDQAMHEFTETGIKTFENDELTLPIPDVSGFETGNEIDNLAQSFRQMTLAIRLYMRDLAVSRNETAKAEKVAATMASLAHKDTMTGVKNKTAYNDYVEQIDREIAETGEEAEFAVVVIDLNDLKGVNDTYGHQAGDKYIVGTCRLMSHVFKHSPVFRIGGDEFVAILRGDDYAHREELFGSLMDQLREAEHDTATDPWLRYSASAGMARYHGSDGEHYSDVFSAADHRMYDNKKAYRLTHRCARDEEPEPQVDTAADTQAT